MFDFLLEILELNIDYRSILTYSLVYVLSLWLLFAVWVFFDAKKRYENSVLPYVLFLVVFVLNFPALIFYLIIRPEDTDDYVYIHQPEGSSLSANSNGGVVVPLAQFANENGDSVLTFQISINKEAVNPHMDVSVKVSDKLETKAVEIESTKENTIVINEKKQNESSLSNKLKERLLKIKEKISAYSKELKEHEKSLEKTVTKSTEQKLDDSSNLTSNKNSNSDINSQKKDGQNTSIQLSKKKKRKNKRKKRK